MFHYESDSQISEHLTLRVLVSNWLEDFKLYFDRFLIDVLSISTFQDFDNKIDPNWWPSAITVTGPGLIYSKSNY